MPTAEAPRSETTDLLASLYQLAPVNESRQKLNQKLKSTLEALLEDL